MGTRQKIGNAKEEETKEQSMEEYGSLAMSSIDLHQQSHTDSASKAFEIILSKVGDYNFYQWKLLVITGFCGFFTSFHNMGAVFLAATPAHLCNIPYFQENNLELNETLLNVVFPWVRGKNGSMEPSKCSYYDYDYSSLMAQDYTPLNASSDDLSTVIDVSPSNVTSCRSWNYDDSIYNSTAVTEWDLVCDKRWMMSSIQSSYMMGILFGAVFFSVISDIMGRRVSSLICCCFFFLASVSAAFTKSFALFLVLRFIAAGAGQGMFLVNFILLMETVSMKGRNVMGNLFHVFFSIGFVLLCYLAYIFREWRQLQLIISTPTVVLLLYCWLLPESPRWLLMNGMEEGGLNTLKSIAKANRKKFPSEEELKPLLNIIAKEVKIKKRITIKENMRSILDSVGTLVRTPNMRRRNLIIFYAWFVTSMLYYGLAFSSVNITSSPYISVGFSALAEFPSLITILFLLWAGRRTVISLCFVAAGLMCIAVVFIPRDFVKWNLAAASMGRFCVSCCFLLVFMFSAELVPTHVRNISIGMASMCARIGSGLAPYIVDLLGDIYYAIPSITFGVLAILAGLLSLLLPETGKKNLPESVEEIEAMPR